jgi:hypothetical protein
MAESRTMCVRCSRDRASRGLPTPIPAVTAVPSRHSDRDRTAEIRLRQTGLAAGEFRDVDVGTVASRLSHS